MTLLIARAFTLNEFGYRRIDQEGIFSDYEKAYDFISESFLTSPTPKDMRLYRSEFIEVEVDNASEGRIISVKEFDCRGELITAFPFEKPTGEQLKKGDIVELLPERVYDLSNIDIHVFGVIESVQDDRSANGDASTYTVFYLSNLGFLDHQHVKAERLKRSTLKLPEELEILSVLSSHYSGEKLIEADQLRKMYNGDYYLKKVETFF